MNTKDANLDVLRSKGVRILKPESVEVEQAA